MPSRPHHTIDGNHLCPYVDMTDDDLKDFERDMKIPMPTFPCKGTFTCRCASGQTYRQVRRQHSLRYFRFWSFVGYGLGVLFVGFVYLLLAAIIALISWGLYRVFGG